VSRDTLLESNPVGMHMTRVLPNNRSLTYLDRHPAHNTILTLLAACIAKVSFSICVKYCQLLVVPSCTSISAAGKGSPDTSTTDNSTPHVTLSHWPSSHWPLVDNSIVECASLALPD